MAHEIKADSNTYVGYNFLTSEYYVKNIETTTAAKTPQEAKLILDITAPRNYVSIEDITLLSRTFEPITDIYYTLEDTGKYIKTIYFNTYKTFSMQYDEPLLYIQGSNEVWNMSSTISVESISTFMWQYYVYQLGLDMPKELINRIIKYFKDIQTPYVYNTIKQRSQEDKDNGVPLEYTNELIMNNADGTSRGEYTATKNPDNEYTLNTYNIFKAGVDHVIETYDVDTIEMNYKRINLTKLYDANIFIGKQIEIYNTDLIDGVYTIESVDNDTYDEENPDKAKTHLIVVEEFEKNYVPLYGQDILRILPVTLDVVNITNEGEQAINTSEAVPTDIFKVGDEIEVFNTGVVDSFYTIKSISGNKIIIEETFSESYTPKNGPAKIVRESAKKVKDNSITCVEEPFCQIYDNIQITTSNGFLQDYSVLGVAGNKIYVDKEITELKVDNKAKAWCNAYKIDKCGYENYSNIIDARQIWKIDGANVYLYDGFSEGDYKAGMTVYLNVKGVITKHTINTNGVIVPNYNTKYTHGYLALSGTLPTYVYNIGEEPAYLEVREEVKIPENSFTLSIPAPIAKGDVFEIFNNPQINGTYTADEIDNTNGKYKIYVKLDNNAEPLPELTFNSNDKNSGIIQIRTYSDKILLNITYSRLADRTPVGEFMLDNNEQLSDYLELYHIAPPDVQNYVNLSQPVTMKYYLGDDLYKKGPNYMVCLGLYSDNYKNA